MITKIDAAEQQLNSAIHLFFENRDHLSSYTLTVASREITDDVIRSRYNELYLRELARVGDPLKVRLSFREQCRELIKREFHRDALKIVRKRQNFLKHANCDPDGEMEDLTARELALAIFFATSNFHLLAQHLTTETVIFLAWFGAAEPQFVRSSGDNTMYKMIIQMRNNITGDPYDADTLTNFHLAMNTMTNSHVQEAQDGVSSFRLTSPEFLSTLFP